MVKKGCIAALALAVLAGGAARASDRRSGAVSAPVGTAVFQLSGLVFNNGMLVNLVNQAIADNGTIANFDAGGGAGVLSVTIHNTGTVPGYCYVVPVVRQVGGNSYNCYSNAAAQQTVATGPLLQTRQPILPGQSVVVNAAGFMPAQGGYNGGFCSNLQNLLNNGFGGSSSGSGSGSGGVLSAATAAVRQLTQLQLSVCLELSGPAGQAPTGAQQACVTMGVFAPPSSVQNTGATLIYPADGSVTAPLPSFVWIPAFSGGASAGFSYELVLSLNQAGDPWYGVQVPSGQTFYQYQASDRALQPGVKYWFHVVALRAGSNQPIGGQNGQGWSQPQNWFEIGGKGQAVGPGAGLVTLPQLDAFLRANANASVLQALAGMTLVGVNPAGGLADPDVPALVAKPSEIKSIQVQKF